MRIIIVESPTKSKTISSYLNNTTVLSSVGHIRDLTTSGKDGLGIDIENDFTPIYKVIPNKVKIVSELKKATKDKNVEVLLATDPDREGEAIAWHLASVLNLDLKQANRITFREITKPAILEAINHPRPIDQDLVYSQEARRLLDRIIGFKLSTLLKNRIGSQSAGRVQSVALKLICDLEKEINAFIPEEYYTISAHFNSLKAEYINPTNQRIKKEQADKIVAEATNPFIVSNINVSDNKRQPKIAYTTSSFQQDAANLLNMSTSRSMGVAHSLYEGVEINGVLTGLITYTRTDSNRLNPLFVKHAYQYIEDNYGSKYLGKYKTSTKDNAQDAHEAIRPTDLNLTPQLIESSLTKEQYRVYKLIYERTLSSLMAPALFKNTKVIVESNQHKFELNGSLLIFDGFTKVLQDKEKIKELPTFTLNQTLIADKVESIRKETTPPARLSEASLVKQLEKEGIGRPSTYASIIKTLKDRKYVEVKEKRFHPTEQGILTSNELDKYFSSFINVKYTQKLEEKLDHIADGKESGLTILKDFYQHFSKTLEEAKKTMPKKELIVTDLICPNCGKALVVRKSKYGEFLGCSGFPKCKYVQEYKK